MTTTITKKVSNVLKTLVFINVKPLNNNRKETYRTRLWTNDERLGDRQRPRVEMSDPGWGAARSGGAGRCLAGRGLLGAGCCHALGGASAGGCSVGGGGARGGAV
ncbi:hypothetical protein ACOSQ2_032299 [Xanthoceras sorbifolium]